MEKKFVVEGKTYTTEGIKNRKELRRFIETMSEIGIDFGIDPDKIYQKK